MLWLVSTNIGILASTNNIYTKVKEKSKKIGVKVNWLFPKKLVKMFEKNFTRWFDIKLPLKLGGTAEADSSEINN